MPVPDHLRRPAEVVSIDRTAAPPVPPPRIVRTFDEKPLDTDQLAAVLVRILES
jgi:hypothetical protein